MVNHVYLNGVRVAAVAPSGSASYYLTDQVDSVTVVLDDGGKIVTQHEYLPFGETWITEGDKKNAPKYNSQELDKESGYYFYNARHYDPEIGRFVTADNIVNGEYDTQGWNRYSYVKNNPVVYKDPTGHVIDTVLDVGFLLYDAGSAVYHAAKGDEEALKEDLVALTVDAACTLIPGATGGGLAARGAMKAGKEVVKRKAATEIAQQTVTKGGKIVKEGVEQLSKKAAKKAETLSKNVSEATHEHHSFPKFLTGDVAKKGVKGGEFTKSSLKLGQEMHKAYKIDVANGVSKIKEFRLPSGKRIDFLDIENGIIYELKPNNPRSILGGNKQLQMYLNEIQSMPRFKGIQWKTILEIY
jgi:RHS repeat-associated protein